VDGKTRLATVKNDGLVILDATDGKTLAFQEWKTRFSTNANTPLVHGSRIFVSTGYNRGCALFEFSGDSLQQIYTSKDMSNHMSNCVLLGDYLYGFDGNTHTGQTRLLKCLEFGTGTERWSQAGLGIGAICASGERLIILSEKGELVIAAATPEKFTPLKRAQVSTGRHWNVPVLAGGFIYVRNAAGNLVAIDVRK
jgi:outer membrane protein assembly factor BamB